MGTFLGGSSLMILGARYPDILITPIAHGTPLDPVHPYTYISALYNTIVCVGIGVLVTYLQPLIMKTSDQIRRSRKHKLIIDTMIVMIVLSLLLVWFNIGPLFILMTLTILLTIFVSISAAYYIKFDPSVHLEGLTVWSVKKAKERFKGSKINDKEGKIVHVMWRERKDNEDFINLSSEDMKEDGS